MGGTCRDVELMREEANAPAEKRSDAGRANRAEARDVGEERAVARERRGVRRRNSTRIIRRRHERVAGRRDLQQLPGGWELDHDGAAVDRRDAADAELRIESMRQE